MKSWNCFLLGTTTNKPIKFPDAIFENNNELQEEDVNQVDIKRETDDFLSYQNLTKLSQPVLSTTSTLKVSLDIQCMYNWN